MNSRQMVERPSKFSSGVRVLYMSGYTNDSLISFVSFVSCGKSCSSFMAIAGTEWLIDATNCDAGALGDLATMRAVFERVIAELNLHIVGEVHWHQFPSPGGITGLALLSESHLACHTYPEFGVVTFNLYCCRARPVWPWAERLREMLGASETIVRIVERGQRTETHTTENHAISRSAHGGEL